MYWELDFCKYIDLSILFFQIPLYLSACVLYRI